MNALLAKLDERPTYPVGKVNGCVIPPTYNHDDFDSDSEEEEEADDDDKPYEQEFVQEELQRYATEIPSQASGFADDVSSVCDGSQLTNFTLESRYNPSDVYKRHNFKLNTDIRTELPIDSYKDQILSRIELNQIIVIEGPTGCGKTTQVPQMIMDSLREKNQYCNIVVTQPRKIATINVAKRVCEERGWTLGTVCGYQVGLEKVVSRDQVICYMTIGVLLQKLIRAKSLREYTHIIIDEVHERNQELDFLLLVVRKFLFTNSLHTKVILMSATINADEFAFYFRKQTAGQSIPAPIIKINKVSFYNISRFFLEKMGAIQNEMPKFDIHQPEISSEVWGVFTFLIKVFDKLNTNVEGQEQSNAGSVLVFLPGINEIEEAHNLLLKEEEEYFSRKANDPTEEKVKKLRWDIIPLHSSLPNDEQAKAFRPPKPGYRKIILSTNIAESSITVPDSCYVIDFCLTKVMTVDPSTKYMSLKLEWASHVNCEQRAGRVGRTCDGRVYRLVTRQFYVEEMERTSTPEILRAPLERIVLQAKMLDLNETPSQILALAMKPPNLKNIKSTLWQLKEMGGLLKTCRGILSNSDGDLTFLGRVMANLPVDVHLSKMIVLGQLFSCLDDTIVIAAGCSIPNIFAIPFQKRLEAYKKVLLWADGSCSDLIALLNLFTVWRNLKRENAFANQRNELEWCKRNLVSLKGLREWNLLLTEITERLNKMQIKETMGAGKVHLSTTEKPTVLKIVMAGAFYPNYFIKTPPTDPLAEREAVKTLGGRDPFCTVYFSGLDPKQPGQIYVRQIKRMIQDRDEGLADVHIGFDGSTKIYVEFKKTVNDPICVNIDGFSRLTNAPSKIPRQVYELIRKRQLRYIFRLNLLPLRRAWEFAEAHGASKTGRGLPDVQSFSELNCYSDINYSSVPTMDIQYLQIHISSFIDAGHFWAQNSNDRTNELLQQIDEALNGQVLTKVDEPLKIGKVYAARYREDGLFYRCRVTTTAGRVSQIVFIDYGNIQEVKADELYYLPQRPQCFTASLAFECTMYGIKPAYRHNPLGMWNDRVNDCFKQWTNGIVLYAEVYSVINDVVELELYRNSMREISVNKYMISQGYADPSNPSFLSKQNHEQRIQVQSSQNPCSEAGKLKVDQIISYTDFADPRIDFEKSIDALLTGPFSPLETKLFGCTSSAGAKSIDIEGTSVNAVLLDTEPECKYGRLLVAAYVGQSPHNNKLKLRQTTLLPNIPGFPMLLTAIFCPTMEPKLTDDNSLVAAILCGLGYNELNNHSLYPIHDIVLNLDTELKIEELEMINKLRYLMNNGVKLMLEIEQNRSNQNELLATQIKIKDHLFGLINMNRELIDRSNVAPQNIQWGRHGGLGLLKPNMDNDEQDIWSLLWFVKMANYNQYQRQIVKNLEDIENMLYNVKPYEKISCMLCQKDTFFLHELRLHVISTSHKREVDLFKENLEVYDDDTDSDD